MIQRVRIVASGPTGAGAKVFVDDVELENVMSVEIEKIDASRLIIARIELCVELSSIEAIPVFSRETLEFMAEAQGLKLVEKTPE